MIYALSRCGTHSTLMIVVTRAMHLCIVSNEENQGEKGCQLGFGTLTFKIVNATKYVETCISYTATTFARCVLRILALN